MNFQVTLTSLPGPLKRALLAFILLQVSGVLFGLTTLFLETDLSMSGTVTHYRGDPPPVNELEIQENFEKPLSQLLLTTHNHLLGFSFIFILLMPLFYLSNTVMGTLKNILLIEPFISVLITFLSIWGLRFISPHFVYLSMFFGLLTYISYFLIVGIISYELAFKKSDSVPLVTPASNP